MKYKTINALHEIRMSIVQIGFPVAIGIGYGIRSGFFKKVGAEVNDKINKIKTKKIKPKLNKDERVGYTVYAKMPDGTYRGIRGTYPMN